MISRQEALVLLKKYLREEENIRYSFAVEAIMREIAIQLDKDEELWGVTGLLHNLDYEYTIREPEKRGNLTSQLIAGILPEKIVNAIKAINYMHTDYIPTTTLDKMLIASETVVGLIMAIARSIPSQKISDIDLELLITKYKDSEFAARYNRSRIQLCTDAEMEISSFLNLSLNTLKNISDDLGL